MARTARQRAALKKAQLASARKRRGKGKGKLARANRKKTAYKRYAVANAVVAGAAVGLAGYKSYSGSSTGKSRARARTERIADREFARAFRGKNKPSLSSQVLRPKLYGRPGRAQPLRY